MTAPRIPPICPYCQRESHRITGAQLYNRKPELSDKIIYQCAPCDARVGCHPGTDVPLGRLANAELRRAKMAAHYAFDPIWRAQIAAEGCSKKKARNEAYGWLAVALGIPREDCHIGMMDVETCHRVVDACRARRNAAEAA